MRSIFCSNRVMRRYVSALALLMGALAASALAGCGTQAPQAPQVSAASLPTATITAKEFSFVMPKTLPAGPVEFTFINQGGALHQAQFFHLKPGATEAQFTAALQQSPLATRAFSAPAGGASVVAPGGRQQFIVTLLPGTYMVICLVRTTAGQPHYALGMLGSFTVTGGTTKAATPATAGQVTMQDFQFTLPTAIATAGKHVFEVVNNGPQPHEMEVLKLAPGKTTQDAEAYLRAPAGPAPFMPDGGIGALAPHTSGWVTLDLAPGSYLMICNVLDSTTGKPHVALGMFAPFTVA